MCTAVQAANAVPEGCAGLLGLDMPAACSWEALLPHTSRKRRHNILTPARVLLTYMPCCIACHRVGLGAYSQARTCMDGRAGARPALRVGARLPCRPVPSRLAPPVPPRIRR